ncbi:hypothetical protein, partial [Streptococcus pneumoniae]|uniref:hypothetical protein n=1 Tax=Streptococcus pneumoniae TaxID=1313 RepID=UPI0018B09A3F
PLNMGAVAIEAKKHQGEAYDVGTIIKFITLGKSLKWINALGKAINALTFGKFGWHYKARVCSEHVTHLGRAGGATDLMG